MNEEQEIALKAMKNELKKLRIYHLQYDNIFILQNNASVNKFAWVLSQIQDGIEVLISLCQRLPKIMKEKTGLVTWNCNIDVLTYWGFSYCK